MELKKICNTFGVKLNFSELPIHFNERKKVVFELMRKHGVVLLEKTSLNVNDYLEFGKMIGTIRPFVDENYRHPEYPEIFVVSNLKRNGKKIGMDRVGYYWHSDSSFLADPLPITILYAQEVPTKGGETSFIDMSEAYEKVKHILPAENLTSMHEGKWKYIVTEDDVGLGIDEIIEKDEKRLPAPEHPLILIHPFSNKRCLYLTEGISNSIVQMDIKSGSLLINEIWKIIKNACQKYTHTWNHGDLLIWDNRRMIHRAYPAIDGSGRLMFRMGIEDNSFFTDKIRVST